MEKKEKMKALRMSSLVGGEEDDGEGGGGGGRGATGGGNIVLVFETRQVAQYIRRMLSKFHRSNVFRWIISVD